MRSVISVLLERGLESSGEDVLGAAGPMGLEGGVNDSHLLSTHSGPSRRSVLTTCLLIGY